jgi:hypothetical protein
VRLLAQRPRVVRARSWDELPEILEPGTYIVDGEKFIVVEPVEKEFMRMAISGIKKFHAQYYGR